MQLTADNLDPYQVRASDWMLSKEEGFLWLGLGDGKTAIALRAIAESGETALVVGSKNIVSMTWPQEIATWSFAEGLSYAAAVGPKRNRCRAVESEPDILGVSYENLKWLYETYAFRRHWLIFDESTKMKSHATKRLRTHRRFMESYQQRFGMTATPAPEDYIGLWGQSAAIMNPNPLGRNITAFRRQYTEQRYKGMFTDYVVGDAGQAAIEDALEPYIFTIPDSERPKRPEPTVISHRIPWSVSGARDQYREMERTLILEMEGKTIEAVSMGVAYNKCRQLATGFIYDKERNAHVTDTGKFDAVEESYEALGREPVVVFYQFEFERDELFRRLRGSEPVTPDRLDAWNAGDVPALIAHPVSAGHGLNLQGPCRHVFWASLPWSLEQYQQANGRIDRRGQTGQVVISHFMRDGTIDEDVLAKLHMKSDRMEQLVQRMKERNG